MELPLQFKDESDVEYDIEDAFDNGEIPRNLLPAVLKYKDGKQVRLGDKQVYTVKHGRGSYLLSPNQDGTFSVDELGSLLDMQTAVDFLLNYGIDMEQKFHDDFWSWPPNLYHFSPSENVAKILRNGLMASSNTRGISNRGVGNAVFCFSVSDNSLEETAGRYSAYGDALLQIDCAAMKRNGLTPFVSQEPDVVEHEAIQSIAYALGEDFSFDIEDGMDLDTVIVYGAIPAKYIKQIDY